MREEARPDVRDADELHDALQTLVAVAGGDWRCRAGSDAIASWTPFLAELMEGWRVVRATVGGSHPVANDAATRMAARSATFVASERAKILR